MSAVAHEQEFEESPEHVRTESPGFVTVRRNIALSAPLGAGASAVAIAYLWRASSTGSPLDWALCGVMAAVAAVFLVAVVDARTPLLVADDLGVRIRLGSQWRGLPWDAVQHVVVVPRKGAFRDGRLLVVPHSLGRAIDGLDARARRQASLNQKLYGAALAVPLGLVTRVSAAGEKDIADRIAVLSLGRSDIVTLIEPESVVAVETAAVARGGFTSGLGHLVSRVATRHAPDDQGADTASLAPAATAVPLRERFRGQRAEVATGAAAPDPLHDEIETVRRLPEAGKLHVTFEPVLVESNVRPIARVGDAVEPLVIDGFETQPAYDPVIGPQLMAARTRVGLTVDELAERTRIRPHVIESIEVDDFAPCGGDVYARGHIRTLSRVLGQDAEPLLRAFDDKYAEAPISARRVFEAELATGMTGSIRSTHGGPNWSLLVGLVLTLVLVWGVVRLFAGAPNEMVEQPPPLPDSASWPSKVYDAPKNTRPKARTVPLKLVALNASTRVHVTDRAGNVVFHQQLVYGETRTVRVSLPIKLSADNGGALSVRVGKRDYGLLGQADTPAVKDFGANAAG